MKPAWDKLMAEFADSKTVLVGDVDCTAAGKSLCTTHGVQGYPTIKSGDPTNLEDYKGGREFDALKAHAASLKPSCNPSALELCDAESKAKIMKIMDLDNAALEKFIAEQDGRVEQAEETFKAELEKLQATYKELMATKEAVETEVKASGVGLYKSVLAAKKKGGDKAKDEL